MATNYTSLLGFALPTTGELTNTWGNVVNSSVTQLVEDSVAGVSTQSVAGGNWTLSTTGSGASNEARSAILIATGSPGTTRSIIAPSQSKAYIVINDTDSTLVIKGAATTGVSIPTASKALVAWNGSDFVQIGASAGGSNTQVQYNSGGALAGSANLTFDGTTLTAANFADSSLTSTRVVYAGASGNLTDSANLTFDGTTLSANTITAKLKAYSEAVTTATVNTATYNLDTSLTNIFDITLDLSTTFTFTNPPSSGTSRSVTVILRQGSGGNKTAAFTNAKYSDGLTPTLSTGAGQVDVLTFFTVNGGSFWFGTFAMANVS